MAKIISPRILTPSTSLLFPSTLHHKSLFPSQSLSTSTKPATGTRFPRKLNGPSLVAMASSSAAVVPDDISDVLGEVSIFTAAGEPVAFKDLWDQQEVLLILYPSVLLTVLISILSVTTAQFLKFQVLFHCFDKFHFPKCQKYVKWMLMKFVLNHHIVELSGSVLGMDIQIND